MKKLLLFVIGLLFLTFIGCKKEKQILSPTVATAEVTEITSSTAACGGEVTADGGAAVTARGVCWSVKEQPTLADAHTTDGEGTGPFISDITGLEAGTQYYVRAYATNSSDPAGSGINVGLRLALEQ